MFNQQVEKGKSSQNLITLTHPHSTVSEEFNTVRTNLQFTMVEKPIKTILFTSSIPDEGKTTTIANVAISFAKQGGKVLLVDADLRNASIHQMFQLNNVNGLTTLLTNSTIPLDLVIKHSNQSNLDILTSGPLPPNPSELLGSDLMESVIGRLKEKYDFIFFDAPPILPVSDAQILGSKVDGTVLIIKQDFTNKTDVFHSQELLEQSHAKILGVIFNDKKRMRKNDNGYYGYNQ
ncbi:CpsD/CapB family tyrosine-protein kinase [Lacticigenium naphthae]|uniref:CpsD/CapB family tyrosine-protein kinase n=1 Tax=Lacticigenium naphthae TaxID=515351 RepID=UPI0004253994|nr:CpsD/CapB family tyrosine-protein kinase [Lacticigenium naphthae]